MLFEPEAEWDKFYQALRVFEDHFAVRNSALRWLVTQGSSIFKKIKTPKVSKGNRAAYDFGLELYNDKSKEN